MAFQEFFAEKQKREAEEEKRLASPLVPQLIAGIRNGLIISIGILSLVVLAPDIRLGIRLLMASIGIYAFCFALFLFKFVTGKE